MPMTLSDAGAADTVAFFSTASVTGTNPSPNKRGLHCLSVLLTDRMELHDATTLSDRTH
jgi:hypothetical protein